jgi:hypothetical protein
MRAAVRRPTRLPADPRAASLAGVLLTLSTIHRPATDLGFLLHKHPERVQNFSLTFGEARVFYPEAGEKRCTAALLVDVDPVGLVRRGGGGFALAEYVNDRPYAASSFMSVAMVSVFKTAMAGICKGHEELAAAAILLEAWLPSVAASGGPELARRLFEPLGWEVEVRALPLDPSFPAWGEDRHLELRLRGERWLPEHPERELIARRYSGGWCVTATSGWSASTSRCGRSKARRGDSTSTSCTRPSGRGSSYCRARSPTATAALRALTRLR